MPRSIRSMLRKIKLSEPSRIAGVLIISAYRNGVLLRQSSPLPNKVVLGSGYGRDLILRQLSGDTTYALEIDSAAVGDDDTAATDADTALGSALVSGISITNMTITGEVLNVDVFVADGNLADDTYQEFGIFCDSRLFARVVIDPAYTKVSGEDTLFSYSLTLSG